jgi:heterodisulfide reductase subunit D
MLNIPSSMVRIFNTANVDFTLLGQDEWCCGTPLSLCVPDPKDDPSMIKLVNHNIQTLKKLGVQTLITSCAGCYRAFKKDYPQINKEILDIEVLHSSEYIEELVDSGYLEFRKKITDIVTYHDPCELGRHCGVYEPPRKVLESIPGLQLNELQRSKKNCHCCGGGGLTNAVYPQQVINVASTKLNEASEVGAGTIVSCCASCKMTLENAVASTKTGMKVLDLVEIVSSIL